MFLQEYILKIKYNLHECDKLCMFQSGVQQKKGKRGRSFHMSGIYHDIELWPRARIYFFYEIRR